MTAADPDRPVRVLFVCLGNICRSPLAEGLFRHHAQSRGVADHFEIDSAGTGGWHAGELPDARMRATAQARGVVLDSRARQVVDADFEHFDHVICMDDDNLDRLLTMGAVTDRTRLLLSVAPDATHREVPDPYYGGQDGFELVYDLVDDACQRLLDELAAG